MERLFIRPEPYLDESFMGYLLRLSEENLFETPFSLLEMSSLKSIHSSNFRLIKNSELGEINQGKLRKLSPKAGINEYVKQLVSGEINLSKLAHLTGELVDVLESLRYPIVHSTLKHYPDIHDFYFYDVPSNYLRFAYPRLCIECIKEKPYHRASWDFAPMTCCPVHNSLLLDVCPSCNQQLNWSRNSLVQCQCGHDLLLTPITKLDANETWLSYEIQALINYSAVSPMVNDTYQVATRRFDDLIDVIEFINRQSNRLSDSARKDFRYEFQWQPNTHLHNIILCLVNNFDSEKPFSDKSHIHDSLTLAARKLGLKDVHSNKSIKQKLTAPSGHYLNRQLELISKSALCSIFGISPRLMSGLEHHDILKPVTGPKVDKSGDYHYAKTEVIELQNRLKSLSKASQKSYITIKHFLFRSPVNSKRPFGLIIKSLLNSEIGFNFLEGSSLLSIQLDKESLDSFLQKTQRSTINEEYLTVKNAADILNIYSDAVYRSLKAGVIPHKTHGKTKLIHREDLERFNNHYVFVSELAQKYSCNPTNLADKIMDEGIKPVSGPNIDGNLLNIFFRNDINKLDMHMIINKEHYDTNTGRKSKQTRQKSYLQLVETLNLVSSTQAANMLGISTQQLAKLVRIGYIQIENNPSIPTYKKYIQLSEIERYRAKFENNPELVSKKAAAAFMAETDKRFYNNWIKYKRIELVNDGLDTLYVRKKALEKIKTFQKWALSTADACELLGVKKHEIDNQRKLGKLVPISGPGIDSYGNYFYKRDDIESLSNEEWWCFES